MDDQPVSEAAIASHAARATLASLLTREDLSDVVRLRRISMAAKAWAEVVRVLDPATGAEAGDHGAEAFGNGTLLGNTGITTGMPIGMPGPLGGADVMSRLLEEMLGNAKNMLVIQSRAKLLDSLVEAKKASLDDVVKAIEDELAQLGRPGVAPAVAPPKSIASTDNDPRVVAPIHPMHETSPPE